jgi:hypothetical protein
MGTALIGAGAIVVGILSIVFNRQLRDLSASGQRVMFGDKTADKTQSTPLWSGIPAGATFMLLGVIFIIVGLTR